MNQTYRLVWSHAQQAWVVASELARSATKGKCGGRKRKALVAPGLVSTVLLAAVSMPIASSEAANYVVASEAELRQAIIDANADGDVSSTITLSGDIMIVNTAAFAQATKPLIIDTAGFVLSAEMVTTTDPGIDLSFLGGSLVTRGAFTGGAARNSNTSGAGGAGLILIDGALDNEATVTGGRGGFRTSSGSGQAGAGGVGARLTDSSLLNRGTIQGGEGGEYNGANATGSGSNRSAGTGGIGLAMTNGSLDNRGSIVGGNGGSFINLPSGGDNAWGGAGGVGADLTGGAHSNSGTITGGNGGRGANAGGGSGAYPGGIGLVLRNSAAFVNEATGTITGGNGNTSIGSAPASVGGAGASVGASTLENYGTISGGRGGSTSINGGVGVAGTGNANIINDGAILGGTRSNGSTYNSAVSFGGANNRLELRSNSAITGNVIGGATDTLALGGSVDASFDVSAIGASAQYRNFGKYEKTGASTWTLTGTTAAVTPWTLLDGVLDVSNDASLGATTARLTFDGGTLRVTGATFNGTARPITIAGNGGGIDVDNVAQAFTISSAIDGSGALTKLGTGRLILTADNTYAGGTTIAAGALQLGNGGTSGSIASGAVLNNGSLIVNRSDNITFASPISGSGSLVKMGAGVTTLSGVNTYSGGTTISGGMLAGSATSFGSGPIVNDTGLIFQQVTDATFGNLISGAGGLLKQGSGTLTLTANNTFTGSFSVGQGALFINGDQSAATGITSVINGATLGGTGTIGGTVNLTDGVLAPGANSVGTLTILGNLMLNENSTLNFELGAHGVVGGALNDLIEVQGDVRLDGVLNVAIAPGGTYGPGTYRLINYGGSLTNNVLDLGLMPAGTAQTLDLTQIGQVNLINTQGLVLRWWDGDSIDPSDRHDGVIAGGPGTWNASGPGTNLNWTDETGTPNAGFLDASFAMFTSAPGTVTVDTSLGAVRVAGMQFTVDGYRIDGDEITLTPGTNTIRVGDGTSASANMRATIASEIAGAGGLDKADGGTLVLTATNTYAGATTISQGTLQLGDGGTTGSISGNVTNNATLAFNRADDVTFAGTISGTGSVSQLGAGTTTLSGANVYAGGTRISSGTLAGTATSFGSGSILNDAALTITQASGSAEFANVISGTGALTKLGNGTLTLMGNSTFAGTTTIAAGTLQLGNGGATGSLAGDIVNGGTLNFNRSNAMTYAGDITGFGDVNHQGTGVTTLTGNSEINVLNVSAGELRLADGAQMTLQGVVNDNLLVAGTGGAPVLTVTGAQTSLTMSAANIWVGNASATSGTFNVENGANVSINSLTSGRSVGNGAVAITNISGAGTLFEADSANLGGLAASGSRSEINVSGGATVQVGSHEFGSFGRVGAAIATTVSGANTRWTTSGVDGTRVYGGALNIDDGATYETTGALIGGWATLSQALVGSLNVSGSGSSFTSTGAINVGTNTGATGNVTVSDGGSITTSSGIVLGQVASGNAVLNVGGTLGDAARAAGTLVTPSIAFGPGAGMLNFNHTSDDFELAAGISGQGTINHLAGITTLTGNGSAFSGTTMVDGGTLYVGLDGVGSLGSAMSLLQVVNGATLGGSGLIGGTVTIDSGGTLSPGNSPGTLTVGELALSAGSILDFELGANNAVGGSLNDLIVVTGDLTLDGVLNVTQSAGGTFEPGVYRLINYGGALTDNTLALGVLPAGSDSTNTFVQTSVPQQVNLVTTKGLTFRFWDGPLGYDNSQFDGDDGVWLATGNRNWTVVDPFVNGEWDDRAFAVFLGAPGTVAVDESAGQVNFSGMQFMVDGFALTGDALHTQEAETYIRVGDGTSASAAMTATIDAEITGSGGVIKSDAGTLILTGDNTYTGGTKIAAGTLQLGDGGTSGSILHGDLENEGTLAFNRADAVTFAGVISGMGAVEQRGAGTTTLSGANTYTGGTTIASGVLAGSANAFGTGEIENDGVLRLEQTTDAALANVISGAGVIEKRGTGALELTADNSAFSGATQVLDGTLRVNGAHGDAASTLHVAAGATLGGAGSIGGDVTVAGGRVAPGNSPGTLTIAGDFILDAASVLDFELGEANVVGGALNDLIVVNGDLTLDGTLNVTASAGGTYGAGIYRLIDYSGALTNNGLDLGSMPAGSTSVIQTSIAQQVNLVNTAGLLLRYWDGPTGPANNGVIEGGSGVWLAGFGNENWTLPDGSINGGFQDGAFAVFASASGTVTVDDSLGAINVSGMQFASDGYRIEGNAVNLLSGTNTIRVGDGSTAASGFTATIASELTGSGGLDKADLGTLVLAADNSYSGGTTISAGTLQLGEGGMSGSIVGDVVNDGVLAFNRSDAATFDGAISGNGDVRQIGAGVTTLTAANSYSGVTRIEAGTLALSGAGSIAASSNVIADGVFDIAATDAGAAIVTLTGNGSVVLGAQTLQLTAAAGTFGGAITGAGEVDVTASQWTLSGAGSEVGALTVRSGVVDVASTGGFGAQRIEIAKEATVNNAGAFGGTALADELLLSGTLTGKAQMLGGDDRVVIADGANFAQAQFDGGAGSDTLDLTHSAAMTFDNALTANFEHFVKRGAGSITFAGAVSGISDSITLAEGSAHLASAQMQTARVHVMNGVTLSGEGALSGALINDGIVSPGNSPGLMTVGGDFTQSANGTLISEIQRGGNDLIEVAGVANLAGAHEVQIDYGLYLDGTTQTVLRALGGTANTFDTVTLNPSALMTAEHRVRAQDVTVSFARLATTTVTESGTTRDNFARWLDEQIAAGGLSPEMIAYIDTLLQQPTAAQAANLLGELSEPVAGVAQENVSILDASFASGMFDRFTVESRAQCVAVGGENALAQNCAWVRGLRQWGDHDGDRFGPRYDWTLDGVQVGIDHSTQSGWSFGASAGYAQTDTHDANDGRNDVRSILGGLYANYTGDRFGVSAVALHGSHESKASRNSALGDSVLRAQASFEYDSTGVGLRADYRLTAADRALVRPFVEAFYDRIGDAHVIERGAAAGNLQLYVHEREGLRGTVGIQFADTYEGYGMLFRPSLELGVVHQFLDTQSTLDIQPFADRPAFQTYGVQNDRTSYRANAALGVSVGSNATLSLGYGGEVASDRSHHEVTLGFRVMW